MTLSRREVKENPTAGFKFPKPTYKPKPVKWPRAKPPRRIEENIPHAGYLRWIHEQRCVVTDARGSLYDKIDASHVGLGGTGKKAGDDIDTVPMLRSVHRDWTLGMSAPNGRFGQTRKRERQELARRWLVLVHAAWFALPQTERERYQADALAERAAMRGRRR